MTSQTEYSTQTPKKSTLFSGQYLRNHWNLDTGVLGYIGIVWPKKHSPEVSHIPPVTPCIHTHTHTHTHTHLGTRRLRGRPRNRWKDKVREDGRIVGGEGCQETEHNREEWKKILGTARNHRILYMPIGWMNSASTLEVDKCRTACEHFSDKVSSITNPITIMPKIQVFWDVIMCSWVRIFQRFEGF